MTTRSPEVDGRASSLDAAIEAAAGVLTGACLPLVYGLVDSTVEAQREAVRIADLLGGLLDSAASPAHRAASEALERGGALTASLGEVASRADLLVFWGCDPEAFEEGFLRRYATDKPGRRRLRIDVGEAQGPPSVPVTLALEPRDELSALSALRLLARGRRVDLPPGLGALRAVARELSGSSYAVLFTDGDPPPLQRETERPRALTALAQDLGSGARIFPLRRGTNAVGAENVLAWQTGFPSAVSFARGYPRYGPGEFNGESALARRDVDAVLLMGVDATKYLSSRAIEVLRQLPTVELTPPGVAPLGTTPVVLPVAPLAHTAGTVFRMDGVALRQAPGVRDDAPEESAVLAGMAAAIERRVVGALR